MRYTDTIVFVKSGQKHYDPDLGEMVATEPTTIQRDCRITSPSFEKSALVFGDLRTNNIIVHMKRIYKDTYDYCLVGKRKYFFVTEKLINNQQVIVLKGDIS